MAVFNSYVKLPEGIFRTNVPFFVTIFAVPIPIMSYNNIQQTRQSNLLYSFAIQLYSFINDIPVCLLFKDPINNGYIM